MSDALWCKCGHSREFHFINTDPVMCDFEGACPAGCTEFVPAGAPTVPRVARSVDEFKVGQIVGFTTEDETHHGWVGEVTNTTYQYGEFKDGSRLWHEDCATGRVVILRDAPDPPARDWLVPATQMEALREALGHRKVADFSARFHRESLYDAARAVLDAAREVEHE